MTTRKPKPLPLLPEPTGIQRAGDLRTIFNGRVHLLCRTEATAWGDNLTVEQAERAVFQAAEELMETLRGSVRRAERKSQ